MEVGIDPLVQVSEADLEEQFRVASELIAMQSTLNRGLRGMDVVAEQLKARRETAERMEIELSADLKADWKQHVDAAVELMDALTRTEGKPFWSQGPRLGEQIGNLFGNVDSQFAAPTAAQLELLAELREEYEVMVGELTRFFEESVPFFNSTLASAGIPEVAIPNLQDAGAQRD